MSEERKWGPGSRENWNPIGVARLGELKLPLFFGEHPHSTRDNNLYVEIAPGHAIGFDGHRVLIDVSIESRNYLKDSHHSGSEIRKSGTCAIKADGVQVYEFFFRDAQWALLEAHRLIGLLGEHSSGWLISEERARMVGRKIFYREIPCIITALVESQGCVMISTESGEPFPPPVYADADDDDERESTIKDVVTSPHIWWHRE